MFIAMNRFKVMKGSEHDFEQVWLNREDASRRDAGLHRLPPAEGARARGPRPLFLAHHVALARRLRGLDQVGAVPQGARRRRRQQAACISAIPSSRASPCCRRRRPTARASSPPSRARHPQSRARAAVDITTETSAEQRARAAGGAARPQRRRHARADRARVRRQHVRGRAQSPAEQRAIVAGEQVRRRSWRILRLGARCCFIVHTPDIVLECDGHAPARQLRPRLLQSARRQPHRRPHPRRQLPPHRLRGAPVHGPRTRARSSSSTRPARRCSRSSCAATRRAS